MGSPSLRNTSMESPLLRVTSVGPPLLRNTFMGPPPLRNISMGINVSLSPPPGVPTDLGHPDPLLEQAGTLGGPQPHAPQAGADDSPRQAVELAHGGPDAGTGAFASPLVPLGPEGPQALVGHQAQEELLGTRGQEHWGHGDTDVGD